MVISMLSDHKLTEQSSRSHSVDHPLTCFRPIVLQMVANSHQMHGGGSSGGGVYANGTNEDVGSQTTLGLIAAPATTHYYYYHQQNSSPQVRYPQAIPQAMYGHPMALQVPQGPGGHTGQELGPHAIAGQAGMAGLASMSGPPQAQELSKTNLYIKGLAHNTTDRDLYNLCVP